MHRRGLLQRMPCKRVHFKRVCINRNSGRVEYHAPEQAEQLASDALSKPLSRNWTLPGIQTLRVLRPAFSWCQQIPVRHSTRNCYLYWSSLYRNFRPCAWWTRLVGYRPWNKFQARWADSGGPESGPYAKYVQTWCWCDWHFLSDISREDQTG